MSDTPPLYGFTLLRNGKKYDYPFRESLAGLRGLCAEVVVALGNSEDGTEAEVAKMDRVLTVPTVWDEAKRQGGVILSEQTNIALAELRKRHPRGWGFYLQADEAISERDFARIRDDIARADREGYDCVSFRYLHFWQSYERICVGKRWYPQEIRAVKLDTAIESYGDAQSFRGWKRRFESDATIFHYGHVREASAYEKKKRDFHRWWHPDTELASVIARGEKSDRLEPTVAYLGPHPESMRERIAQHGGLSDAPRKRLVVFGNREDYSPEFLARVRGDLQWTKEFAELRVAAEEVVMLRSVPFWRKLGGGGKLSSQVPNRMGSPQAREWGAEFQALLRFSERGVRVD